MSIFDKFFTKFSYKFDKGYPDMKDPKDIVLLKKLVVETLGLMVEEKDYNDQILDLLSDLSDDEAKKKVIAYLSKINKKEDKEDNKLEENIIKHLADKNLTGDIIDSILFKITKSNQLQQFSDYLDNPNLTHSDLLNNNNLNSLFGEVSLNPNLKNKIINISGALGNITFGKGEIALIVFLKGAIKFKSSKEQKGDIQIEGHVLELKRGKFIVAPAAYISRATKSDLFKGTKSKEFVEKYNIDLSSRTPWPSLIVQAKPEEKEVKEILKEVYPGLNVDVDLSSPEALNTSIGLALAKDYLTNKDLLLISEQNNYICVENYSAFEQGVKSGLIGFSLASDIIPRCYIN
jgi:hypothetical protein